MKVINVAGVLLVLLLAGCADMYPGSSSKSSASADASSQNRMVAYHNVSFGDPDNQPFQGSYPDR